jgi:hypothetical protein
VHQLRARRQLLALYDPDNLMRYPWNALLRACTLRHIDGLTLAASFTLATDGHPPDGDLDAPLISEASLGSPGVATAVISQSALELDRHPPWHPMLPRPAPPQPAALSSWSGAACGTTCTCAGVSSCTNPSHACKAGCIWAGAVKIVQTTPAIANTRLRLGAARAFSSVAR